MVGKGVSTISLNVVCLGLINSTNRGQRDLLLSPFVESRIYSREINKTYVPAFCTPKAALGIVDKGLFIYVNPSKLAALERIVRHQRF